MKKRDPKLESMQKTEQDRACSKVLTLVKKSTQKLMLNSAGQRSEVNGPICWHHWMTCDANVADDVLRLMWHLEEFSTWHDWRCVTASCLEREVHESTWGAFATGRNLGWCMRVLGSSFGIVSGWVLIEEVYHVLTMVRRFDWWID